MNAIFSTASFFAMNENVPVSAGKHTEDGRTARADLLAAHGFPDVRDAAERCPPRSEPVPRNDRGLRMEIWR